MNNTAKRRRHARRRSFKAVWVAVSCMMMVALISVGGTMAWLVDNTAPVTNTFTMGNIDITLTEAATNFKMVPGNRIAKDPLVTVTANSEPCWLFVKIETNSSYSTFLEDYEVREGWLPLSGVSGVYYREVGAGTANQTFYVLKGNETYPNGFVTAKSFTKANVDAVNSGSLNAPTLTFTAYAVQKDNVADAATAWSHATGA